MTGETCVSSGVTAQCVNFSNDVSPQTLPLVVDFVFSFSSSVLSRSTTADPPATSAELPPTALPHAPPDLVRSPATPDSPSTSKDNASPTLPPPTLPPELELLEWVETCPNGSDVVSRISFHQFSRPESDDVLFSAS